MKKMKAAASTNKIMQENEILSVNNKNYEARKEIKNDLLATVLICATRSMIGDAQFNAYKNTIT